MSPHGSRDKKKLLARVRRIIADRRPGERPEQETDCAAILQQIAAIRSAVNGLMLEVLRTHARASWAEEATHAERLEDPDQVVRGCTPCSEIRAPGDRAPLSVEVRVGVNWPWRHIEIPCQGLEGVAQEQGDSGWGIVIRLLDVHPPTDAPVFRQPASTTPFRVCRIRCYCPFTGAFLSGKPLWQQAFQRVAATVVGTGGTRIPIPSSHDQFRVRCR